MSLHKKLQLWLSATFLVIITSVFGLILHYSHVYLATQQKVELTNTISALNIALSPFVAQKDKVGIESVINAAFDSGFYGSISLEMNDKSLTISKTDTENTTEAPKWFQQLAPFNTLEESRTLMDGWLQVAELSVTSNNTNSYDQLWTLSVRLFIAFIVILVIAAFSLTLLLRVLLKPLKSIQKRANQISLNQFGAPLPSVTTRELSDVVEAINYMSKHVEAYYVQSADEVKNLHIRAFQDPVSKLNNREFFITQLEPWIASPSSEHCAVWLMNVDIIEAAYQSKQFEKADNMVQILSKQLSKLIDGKDTLARFSRSEFILLVPHSRYDQLERISKAALELVESLYDEPACDKTAAIGMVVVTDQPDMTTIFTQLDNALNEARHQVEVKICLYNENAISPEYTKGKIEWQNLVQLAIDNQLVKFKLQPALDKNNQIIHYEAQAYLEVDDIIYSVNRFVTALDGSDMAALFDIHVLMLVKEYIEQNPELTPIVVNITKTSVSNNQFIGYIEQAMENNNNLSDSILLELPEISFIRNPEAAKLLAQLCEQHNFKFGIGNFGHSFNSVDYLHKVHPQYVKLDFAYTSQLDDTTKRNVVSSIIRIASNFNILTIATHVDSIQQLEDLSQLDISGFQGSITESTH